ncbi:hypothetical protein SH528x_004688 [Novipirellula sp. SH528]|uniref:hypothetical protein n=1 Tax=Novipirellula sp. SH528 TaxID=3454466 RepID=UPI003FA08DAB
MNPKSNFSSPTIAALTIFAAAVLTASWQAVAQSPPAKTATTWQDLGYNELPEGISTDVIPLFEGLNESRGTWSFDGQVALGDAATPLNGSLQIMGNPKGGMIAGWQMVWSWPAKDPRQSIFYTIAALPRKPAFDLMLIRMGPVKNSEAGKTKPKMKPTMFQGTWDLENRTIAWTESDLPNRFNGQPAKQDSSEPRQSFDMVVAADGKISIRNSKHTPQGQIVNGKTILRTSKASAQPVTLTGKHSFKTAAEIADRRIKPWVPPQATEISLLSERGGHFARYKVAAADLMKFLDQLWEVKNDSTAHKRETMSGEGEPANQETMARFLKATGWKPLDKAMIYYSPSKANGAMTTYYYDRETGIAYHERGYW